MNGPDGPHCTGGDEVDLCMPVLFVSALVILRVSRGRTRAVVHYETLPIYLKIVRRALGLPDAAIAGFVGRIVGYEVRRIPHGDSVPSYPSLRMDAMHRVVAACERLAPAFRSDPWVSRIARLLGPDPAQAYVMKQVAHHHVHLHVVPIMACRRSLPRSVPLEAIAHPGWPPGWSETVEAVLDDSDVRFWTWPRWYLALHRAGLAVAAILGFGTLVAAKVLRGGLARGGRRRRFELIAEFIDPRRLGGTPYDADYLVDGTTLSRSDVLLYLTREQTRCLRQAGWDPRRVVRDVRGDGHVLVELARLPLPWTALRPLARLWLGILPGVLGRHASVLAFELLRALGDHLELAPLFDRFSAPNVLHVAIPHGETGWRKNSAVVTSLCRRHGMRSVGCQTRVIDARQYEHCFDCYDLYLSWGRGWQDMLGDGMRFVDRILEVGCTHLDALAVQARQAHARAAGDTRPKVVVFPTEIARRIGVYTGCFYTLGYTLSFLERCAELAEEHPEVDFVVKTKDPEHVDLLLGDERFRRVHAKVAGNFVLERRPRCDYASLLGSADVVLAIGFTTPGIEGLLLGKPVVYYSEIYDHGRAFKAIPGLVAESGEEFQRLARQALEHREAYARTQAAAMRSLDPFHDGQARARILRGLGYAPAETADARDVGRAAG